MTRLINGNFIMKSMEQRLVECVPNFSEGKDKAIIDSIIQPILDNKSVTLLDIDMGGDFNRTVVTMVGEPESVLQTVTECTSIALELIDMRLHSGEHARMGAVDVVPFIPIKGVSMEECIDLSNRYAKLVSDEHSLPVFLYVESSRESFRESCRESFSSRAWQCGRPRPQMMAERVRACEFAFAHRRGRP